MTLLMKSGEVHVRFNEVTYRETASLGLLIQLYIIFEECMVHLWTTLC